MFKYLKGLFSSSDDDDTSDYDQASNYNFALEDTTPDSWITYFIDEDGNPKVDVNLVDFEEKTLQELVQILSGLVGCRFFIPTLDMVKTGLIENDERDKLLYVLTTLGSFVDNLEIDHKNEGGEEKPCISPQDAF